MGKPNCISNKNDINRFTIGLNSHCVFLVSTRAKKKTTDNLNNTHMGLANRKQNYTWEYFIEYYHLKGKSGERKKLAYIEEKKKIRFNSVSCILNECLTW